MVYLTGNVLALILEDLSLLTMQKKTGFLGLVNLIPLGITGRPNIVTNFLRMQLQTTKMIHQCAAI